MKSSWIISKLNEHQLSKGFEIGKWKPILLQCLMMLDMKDC